MKFRRFLVPDARWNAVRGPRTVVNLTQPGHGQIAVRLPLPPGPADAKTIDRALWPGGRVPFDSTRWPSTVGRADA